ncbi:MULTISPECIES: uroporphyrinogen-III synthase [unclassified Tolypothrix]|uniref:uroporphyrinogen-III synthase n=1 Tax=unclassified Tolypothrix TaxID=2649714 RepID=UPI0005EAC2EA|nr:MULTISPECIES: uroporphyrinogen-III synthase [unclassified Tolypothrix]BAY92788.1 uroporphyrinogen III synthase HEM4 [Microchaete diplosiphon NIES-3275]EKF04133.1 uroporphyrinogen-III synthase [Tolypothrix sp. PCC 7601]MBE9088202.1 uroporphyrinogen-III synthase [Tolypothrix sp. LEGE 11397]UYD26708.1 uroporphyrinogen-III synthase [Tolypothrix sp. PCC 7712]UYD37429.1 uroporphyrinogen-III synthase [Tolypothrix sp. PCC 7601]
MTNDKKLPLYGKRILVTAPRSYAFRLSEVIIKKGGLPFLMPTIETTSLTDYVELDAVLRRIDEFDWIAFTSRNGINAFFQRLNVLNISLSALQNCKLCAIGKDAELLLSLCRRVDVIPAESSPVGIVNELAKIADIHQKKILAPVPEVVGMPEPDVVPNFIAGLQKLGMQVTRVPSYQTAGLDKNIYAVELDLLRQGMIDVIAFSSTVEIESFLTMVNSKFDYQHSVIACFGPYTAANAKKLGLEVAILSQDYSSFAGFADAIAQFFTNPNPLADALRYR